MESWAIFCQWMAVQRKIPGTISFLVTTHKRRKSWTWRQIMYCPDDWMSGFGKRDRSVIRHMRMKEGYTMGYKSLRHVSKAFRRRLY